MGKIILLKTTRNLFRIVEIHIQPQYNAKERDLVSFLGSCNDSNLIVVTCPTGRTYRRVNKTGPRIPHIFIIPDFKRF